MLLERPHLIFRTIPEKLNVGKDAFITCIMYGIVKNMKALPAHLVYWITSYCIHLKNNRTFWILSLLPLLTDILGLPMKIDRLLSESDETPRYCEIYKRINCENGGLVVEMEGSYACKCQDDFYGIRCEKEISFKPISRLRRMFDHTDVNLNDGKPAMWWSFLPFTSDSQLKNIYEFHQNNIKRLGMFIDNNDGDSGRNMTSTRILPPAHPIECTHASRLFPLVDIQTKLVQMEPGAAFKPDPKRRNILLDTFYKYFVLQFFDANFNFTVTASQLYGADEATKKELRSFSDGKLKTEIVDDEHYPPSLSLFKRIINKFSPTKSASNSLWFNRIMYSNGRKAMADWAVGHPMSNVDPMFFAMSTLWVREHNRVCNVLQKKWPEWTDDELYNVARRTVIGEMMKIMMDEVMNAHEGHSLSLQHKPQIFHDRIENIHSFTTPFELLLTTMWPTSLPETFNDAPMNSAFFADNRQVLKYGLSNTVKYMTNQEIGMITHGNYGDAAEPMTTLMMKLSRENALQSFNNYRRKLGLNAYRSFYDLTENTETAKTLEKLYDNVDNVEFLAGMLTEKRKQGVLSTVQIMTNSLLVNSILTNPLNSKDSWKPETFGGQQGFDMVRFADIETFVCNNLVDKCNDGFEVKLYAS